MDEEEKGLTTEIGDAHLLPSDAVPGWTDRSAVRETEIKKEGTETETKGPMKRPRAAEEDSD